MVTFTALTTLFGAADAEGLGEAMERLDPAPSGIGVFEMEDGSGLWEVGGYFDGRPSETGLAVLAIAFGARPFRISELPDTDWVAKVRRDLAPVQAGRFFVYGSHDRDKVPTDAIALLIEASMAFGTGHHGTTLGCLRALDRLWHDAFAPRKIADIGCGTAVLGMAAARSWGVPVVASDLDPVAIEVAEANVEANGLGDLVTCVEAAGFDHDLIKARGRFDLVLANILKGPLVELAPAMSQHVAPGGRAILSGLLHEQADDVLAVYRQHGFECLQREDIDAWTTLAINRSR